MIETRLKITALDGMRGLAVLLVFMSHASGRNMSVAPWANFHGIGHIGVYLFFVLSGFLLTNNLLRGQKTLQFFSRRFFRIAPLYFFILLCVTLYQAAGNYNSRYLFINTDSFGILLHFLFLKGDGIFWSICAEYSFYLLLPVLLFLINRFGWKWFAVAAAFYFLWFAIVEFSGVHLPPLKFVLIEHNSQYLDVFACGILGAYVRQKLPEKIVAVIFWGLLVVTLVCVSKNILGAERLWFSLRWISILYGIVFALAVVSAAQGNSWLIVPLQSKVLVFIGITGFGWYLVHLPVMQVVNIFFVYDSAVFRFVVSSLTTSILAFILFRVIEHPGISIGRKVEAYFLIYENSYMARFFR
jgi:peptidoglycan/LPS O-acetylase OafA/YrhL